MRSTLPASHILRHMLLFTFVIVFLMTTIRAAYSLWLFPRMLESNAIIEAFVTGLRFDLALVGAVLFLPVVVCSLLGMFDLTRGLAKLVLVASLLLGLLAILIAELVTPLFMVQQELRPDFPMLLAIGSPLDEFTLVTNRYLLHATIGVILVFLIMFAFIVRLEIPRMLRYRLSRWSALALAIFGGAACVIAVWSHWDITQIHYNPGAAMISADATVNDISLNSAYKIGYSWISPKFFQ